MKRFTIILALMLIGIVPMMAERVTPETARKVATTFLNNNGAKADNLTDLSKDAGFPNLYIFTAEQGFVVMSAEDCVKPILGYSLTGKFMTEGMPENVRGWLQGYSDEIQAAIDSKAQTSTETTQLWKDLREGNSNVEKATAVVGPLIQTRWDQGNPYNNLCPSNCPTGCVATAMAQIMKYWNYPAHGIGSHSYLPTTHPEYGIQTADFNSTNYDWNNMTNTYSNSSTNAQKAAVATLMYHCGVSVDMEYGPGSSGAITAQVADALKTYFNYSSDAQHLDRESYTESVWISMLKAELDLNRPIQYHGTGDGGGHSFVCDGYDSNNKFHFNWGWSGYCDAYYFISNLNPGPGGTGSGSNGIYNDGQGAIFGIHPSECSAAEPTNLTYSLIGLQNLTLNWSVANGAVSYNIYRNNNYVGNSTTNTYSEIAPFGSNVYYVRSVDSNGELSLPSNSVSVFIGYQTPVVDDLEASLSEDEVNLTWTAPEWCYPETESAILNYGSGNVYYSWNSMYFAHRHLAENLAQYAGKAVYKVSTYILYPGTYSVYIYTKSNQNNRPDPNSLAFSNTDVPVTLSNGWYEFNTNGPIILTGTDDLWVVFKQEGTGQTYPVPSFNLQEHNTNAFYAGNTPTNLSDANSGYNCAWFIKTYLTDGTYTYNLYDGETKLNEQAPIVDTFYVIQNPDNNTAHQYMLKTNYYGGETDASNMAGFTLGLASLGSLELGLNDKMTLLEGSKLSVSGTLSSTSPENLVLENGAQLIHNSEGVKATVKKHIDPYTANDNGWYFIASPVAETIAPSEENGFLNGTVGANNNTYDLYYYNEPDYYWKNYESEAFNIEHQKGYLYANGEDGGTTLQFEGTLTPSNSNVSISNLSHSAGVLNGFNLVGNPFACNATIDKDCYVIEGSQVMLASENKVFAPCEGAFVQANSDGYTVTFRKQKEAKAGSKTNSLDMIVSHDASGAFDRVRVRFGEGNGLEKYTLDNKHLQLSLWQDGQDYASAYTNGENELPLSFKAAQNGTYTLSLEANSLNLSYLHLIDNMTGDDVDLLVTPSYTFEAKTSDYASRFRLVFTQNDLDNSSTGSEAFAYVNDGNIIVNHEGKALLQIVDMTGHVVAETEATNRVSTKGMTSGVYVLRLIDNDSVKTQKIVIE